MTYTFIIEPKTYTAFHNEDVLIEQCRTWGLLSEKATKIKTFYYKGNDLNVPCTIVGCVDYMTTVIEFDNVPEALHSSLLSERDAGFQLRGTQYQRCRNRQERRFSIPIHGKLRRIQAKLALPPLQMLVPWTRREWIHFRQLWMEKHPNWTSKLRVKPTAWTRSWAQTQVTWKTVWMTA